MARIALLLVLGSLFSTGAWAQAPYTDPKIPEGWAWVQIRADRAADFNAKCGKTLDPRQKTGWDDPCRQISPQFLANVLTDPQLEKQIPQHGLRLRGAFIKGSIDLSEIDVERQLWIDASRIEGDLVLADAHLHQMLSLQGTAITGRLSAERLRADSIVFLNDSAAIGDGADLAGARIGGNLEMETSSFAGPVDLNSANVAGVVFMNGHASFGGDLNLGNAKVGSNLEMWNSTFARSLNLNRTTIGGSLLMNGKAVFDGDINLISARIDSNLEMEGSRFAGPVNLNRITVKGSIFMRDGSKFDATLNLSSVDVGWDVEMQNSVFSGTAVLNSANIVGPLLMSNHAMFRGDVDLGAAHIGGNLEMETSSFAKPVSLNSANIAGSLFMRDHASFGGDVDLGGTKVGGNLEMWSSSFAKSVNLNRLMVGGTLLMNRGAIFDGELNLVSARIGSNLEMDGSRFASPVIADSLVVGRDLLMGDGARFEGPIRVVGTRIGGTLTLSGAVAASVDLSGTDARELLLAGLGWQCRRPAASSAAAPGTGAVADHWPLGEAGRPVPTCAGPDPAVPPELFLRNAHFADFQDSLDAWPPVLDLEGFHYDRLGGPGGSGPNDMRARPEEAWRDWLQRDPTFSSQPYAELAAVLTAAGDGTTAEAMEYAERERERTDICRTGGYIAARCLWLSFLYGTAGYGIERYMWHVLPWVAGLTLLGVLVLLFSANARRHGPVWMTGASLHRLLPIVSLYKEFNDFFDNVPNDLDPPNLRSWQVFYFACHAVMGWVLGLILLAAMSGLTQKG